MLESDDFVSGVIRFVNACAWVETEDTAKDIKANKPDKEAKKKAKKDTHKTKHNEIKIKWNEMIKYELTHDEAEKIRNAKFKHELEVIEKDYYDRTHKDRVNHMFSVVEAHWKKTVTLHTLAGKWKNKTIKKAL